MNAFARPVIAAAACATLLGAGILRAQSTGTPPPDRPRPAATEPAVRQRPGEYQVKALYLYGFTQYIEWPSSAWSDPDAPFRICISGADPFGAVLDRIVKGEKTQGHPFLVERLGADASLARCQIVFLGKDETPRASAALKALSSKSTLTIGESREFLDAGGAIALVLDAGRVRFDVNLRSPQIKDLRFSSKVLQLARDIWRLEPRP